MSELKDSDFDMMERAVKQAFDLTYHKGKAAKDAYGEDYCLTELSIKMLGVKALIDDELLFALKKIKAIRLENNE